jgi:hypothetical protein
MAVTTVAIAASTVAAPAVAAIGATTIAAPVSSAVTAAIVAAAAEASTSDRGMTSTSASGVPATTTAVNRRTTLDCKPSGQQQP